MSNGLGRGLSSLIPQKVKKVTTPTGETVVSVAGEIDKDRVLRLDPGKISANPLQPRRDFREKELNELMESIRLYGIIQPLVVTPKGAGYELIAGERRLRAAQALGLREVPALVREAEEQEKLELALIENIQREDLNPIELALAYRKLIDEFNVTHDQIAAQVGKSRPVISNTLRFLALPERIQTALVKGEITARHALSIAGLDTEEKQLALFEKFIRTGMSSSRAMKETRLMGGSKESRIKIDPKDPAREQALQSFFGTKAEIERTARGGKITITFFGNDMLDDIVEKVGGIE